MKFFFIIAFIVICNPVFAFHPPLSPVGWNGPIKVSSNLQKSQNITDHTWYYVKFHLPHQNMEVVEQSKDKFIAHEEHDNASLEMHVVPQSSPEDIANGLLAELKNQGTVTVEFSKKVPWQTLDGYEIHGTYKTEDGVHSFWVIGTSCGKKIENVCCSIKMLVALDDNEDDLWEKETESCLTSCVYSDHEGDYEGGYDEDH